MDYSTYPEGPFDVVYDNNGKDLDSCKPLIDAAKVREEKWFRLEISRSCSFVLHAKLTIPSAFAPHLVLLAAQQGMCKHYVFVSSAGAYKADSIEPMHVEGDERKASAGG